MSMPGSAVIVWFRNDLRLADHRALNSAVGSGRAVIACYVLDETLPEQARPGGASRWWLHHSLAALRSEIEERGATLILRSGPVRTVLPALAADTGALEVHASASAEPDGAALEQELRTMLATSGVQLHLHAGALLFPSEAIKTKDGQPFKVFTPFWKACLERSEPGQPMAVPRELRGFAGSVDSETLESWQLLPRKPNWAAGFEAVWRPGEAGAHARLEAFLENGLVSYADLRDRPDVDGTSCLSPYLHFGELSPRQVWHVVRSVAAAKPSVRAGSDAFLRQLGWREFSYHLLHHCPTLPQEPFRAQFAAFPWREDSGSLERWQRGLTGYPIVDAGMRQLWRTGWMHNRVRMVTASFLVKHLLLPWHKGAAWFWDTLVDADLASNSASWQWVAGSGADAAPYFRIFNPILQGKKFDPAGDYVRRWVPELSLLPSSHIHEPWNAPADVLERAGVELGKDYPRPLVDHAAARKRALAAYDRIKN